MKLGSRKQATQSKFTKHILKINLPKFHINWIYYIEIKNIKSQLIFKTFKNRGKNDIIIKKYPFGIKKSIRIKRYA